MGVILAPLAVGPIMLRQVVIASMAACLGFLTSSTLQLHPVPLPSAQPALYPQVSGVMDLADEVRRDPLYVRDFAHRSFINYPTIQAQYIVESTEKWPAPRYLPYIT